MRVHVSGVGVAAPGLRDWPTARMVLSGEAVYAHAELVLGSPQFLPPNERRRVSRTIRLALQVATEAVQGTAIPLAGIGTVFASSCGDLEIVDRILDALTLPDRPVSPTHFHNSVHNAPAGYWSIGSGAPAPASAIAANEATFAAGLLEAATLAAIEGRPTLLVAYDWMPPPAFAPVTGITEPFAAALLLTKDPAPGSAPLELGLQPATAADTLADPQLERLRQSNPIAAALPLLVALLRGGGCARLPYVNGGILRADVGAGA